MVWSIAELADVVGDALKAQAAADDLEQAVYGFDALDELRLHPLIQAALREAGYGVHPEVRFPGSWAKRKRSEGQRCDLVLTEAARPLEDPRLAGTLFVPPDAQPAAEACWLEIKTVAQFDTGGPFRRYSAELFAPVAKDLTKLWGDEAIHHAALLLVLFTQDARVAEHDLHAWHERCVDRGFPVGPPAVRGFPITDRIGNGHCTVAIFGVRGV